MQKTIAVLAVSALSLGAEAFSARTMRDNNPFVGEHADKSIIATERGSTHRATPVPDVFDKYAALVSHQPVKRPKRLH